MPDMPRAQDKRRKGDEKQTERIEVRLGVTLRDQFLGACKRAGDTPSDILRAAMSDYVGKVELAERKTLKQELTMKLIHNPLKTATMALTSLAAFALFAAPSSADERLFKALDENGDGVLTEQDSVIGEEVMHALDDDHSKSVTRDEFTTRVVYGELVSIDTLYGHPEPEDWYDWSEEQQDAYIAALPQYDPVEQALVTVDFSQIGEVHIIRKPMPEFELGAEFPYKKIIITFIPPEEVSAR